MSGYDIFLSNGGLLTSINVKTVDVQDNSSLVLLGQGIPNYGSIVAQDFVWMLENFSKATAPVHPLVGQLWHDSGANKVRFWDGSIWRGLLMIETDFAALFAMSNTATNIDFTTTQTVSIFTGAANFKYYASFLALIPNGAVAATGMPSFNVYTSTPGDMLSSTTLSGAATGKFARIALNSMPAILSGAATVHLQITAAATGGRLNYDAYLFGMALPI